MTNGDSVSSGQPCVVVDPEHAEKLHAREPGDLGIDWPRRAAQSGGRRQKPNGPHARCRGVGPPCSTCEPVEQSREIGCGDWGGKRADQGEHFAITHALDAERGRRVPGIAGCARSSKGKEARTVHGFASPSECRSAAGKLLRVKAASGPGSRWRDVAGV